MGLAITRREGEAFWIGDVVRVTIMTVGTNKQVKVHIEADDRVKILREEIRDYLPEINGRPVKPNKPRRIDTNG